MQAAERTAANQGFRLPTHSEYRSLERNGGINRLGIPTKTYNIGACWEATGGIVHGWGGNLKTLFPSNHFLLESSHRVIGVRNGGTGGLGGGNNGGGNNNNGNVPQQQTVHWISVGDVHSNLVGAVDISRAEFRSSMYGGLGRQPFFEHSVPSNQLFPNNILQYVRNIKVNNNDTVIFTYHGHGASDPNRGMFYTITDPNNSSNWNPLLKSDVLKAIQIHSPRLIVIISDCCSVRNYFPEPKEAVGAANTDPPTRLFRTLFLESKGVVDFTAAQQDHTGWASTDNGFWLTHNFCNVLDNNQNRNYSWQQVFSMTREEAKQFSLRRRNANPTNNGNGWEYGGVTQIPMVPRAFSLGN
ncbi:MAG: caspase family protein [Planctomycetaceae bacterium]|nr:caspase family protein [Planctomycetaceae bacterium]